MYPVTNAGFSIASCSSACNLDMGQLLYAGYQASCATYGSPSRDDQLSGTVPVKLLPENAVLGLFWKSL